MPVKKVLPRIQNGSPDPISLPLKLYSFLTIPNEQVREPTETGWAAEKGSQISPSLK